MRGPRLLSVTILVVSLLTATLAGQQEPTPAEWEKVSAQALDLRYADKPAEAIALLQKFLTRYPNVADAHALMAIAHRDLANPLINKTATPAERTRHGESAAAGYRRALDLTTDPERRFTRSLALAGLYGRDELNRPAEAEAMARRMMAEYPRRLEGYMQLVDVLRGDPGKLHEVDVRRLTEAADVYRKARVAVTNMPATPLLEFGALLTHIVRESPKMPPAEARKLLDEARGIFDQLIKTNRELHMALIGKSLALQTQAERVETDPKLKATVKAESDRVGEQAFKLRRDERRAEMTPAERLEDEWREIDGQARELSSTGKSQEALALLEKFLASHSNHGGAHTSLGRTYDDMAREIKGRDPASSKTRAKHLEQAVSHYQRAASLATDSFQAVLAVGGLVDALGPDGLNRPADADAAIRSAVKKFPAEPMFHYQLVRTAALSGKPEALDGLLRGARDAIPPTAAMRQAMAAHLMNIVRDNPKLPVENARKIIGEAVARLDEALTLEPEQVEARLYKSMALTLQAERVEKDAARVKSLLAEAEKLRAQADAIQKRKQQ